MLRLGCHWITCFLRSTVHLIAVLCQISTHVSRIFPRFCLLFVLAVVIVVVIAAACVSMRVVVAVVALLSFVIRRQQQSRSRHQRQ